MTANYPYQTRQVRDLAWACFAPPILDTSQLESAGLVIENCGLELTIARQVWLQELDRNPQPLLCHLAAQQGRRLGLYFEHLWHFFLAEDPEVELVAHNLAVRDGGRTLGEFDCIYHCLQRDRYIHLELAVKFFLGYAPGHNLARSSPWQQWLGPNSRDRLDLKMQHLLEHQIRLGDHPQARSILEALGVDALAHEVVIKGYLFRGLHSPQPPPECFNPDAPLEYWLSVDQLAHYLADHVNGHYQILPKSHWLAPAVADEALATYSGETLASHMHSHFAEHNRPQLVASLDPDGYETRRFFVTAADWPNAASPT